eukprot:TRINITY_DN3887_c2_g1_i1.p1 TRINITY_DN3887_c2_g1~~TRINITY_DN3887_c2_g1_i1.p1  ORF type:complete len:931 (-),score=169.53 TRINITY_DN3887_c2_g1_i1:1607-4309(-)
MDVELVSQRREWVGGVRAEGDKWVTRFRQLAVRKDPEERARRTRMKRLRNKRNPLKALAKGPDEDVEVEGVWGWTKHLFTRVRRNLPCPGWRGYVEEGGDGDRVSSKKKVRIVRANSRKENKKGRFPGNAVHTTRYGPITFVPKNLFEQFKRLANVWFLIVAVIQLIPGLSPLNPASSFVPLIFVLAVTAIKEAYEDIKRRVTDKKINWMKTEVLTPQGFKKTKWHKLRVGDIVQIANDKPIPADLFILTTAHPEGIAYFETANLDGETNLKVRQALEETASLKSVNLLQNWKASLSYEQPNAELYSFEGVLHLEGHDDIPVNLEQTVWRGSTLRNTEWITGMVLYTGMQTKVMKNSRTPPSKRSTIELEMNRALITIFLFALCLDIIGGILSGVWSTVTGYDKWYLQLADIEPSAAVLGLEAFAAWLILLNVIIPISLYVYLEVVKLVMVYWINNDVAMYDKETNTKANANTSNLAEDLGRIEYIFSDKTGTLTCNKMDFMCCSVNGRSYGDTQQHIMYPEDDVVITVKGKEKDSDDEEMTASLNAHSNKENVHLLNTLDVPEDTGEVDIPTEPPVYSDNNLLSAIEDSDEKVGDFFRLLALCNTVLIEVPEEDDDDDTLYGSRSGRQDSAPKRLIYQAASPDEAALVEAARKMGFVLVKRDSHSLTIEVLGQQEQWELLNVLEFNSDRKRMSVVVRDPRDGTTKLLCKGADSVIFERLAAGQDELQHTTVKHLEAFGMEGLRTLCLAMKVIPEDMYKEWQAKYYTASIQINGREAAMDAVAEEIETDMILLGATAIEDKLQDGVPEAIATLLKAGIKMWVLTGDKMETAINIGYSCSLLSNTMNQIVLSSEDTDDLAQKPIRDPLVAKDELERYFRAYFPNTATSRHTCKYITTLALL